MENSNDRAAPNIDRMTRRFQPLERHNLCAEKTELLYQCSDSLPRTSRSQNSRNLSKSSMYDNQSTNDTTGNIKSVEHSILVKEQQADILRRVMKDTQRELDSLFEQRRNYYAELNNQGHPTINPSGRTRLPIEMIARIFSLACDTDVDEDLGRQSIIRFVLDAETPVGWSRVARRAIPLLVADTSDVNLRRSLDYIKYVVGKHPTVVSVLRLNDPEVISSLPSVSVLVNTTNWPKEDDLQVLDHVHWKKLIIHHDSHGDEDQQEFILKFLQKPRVIRKLEKLEHLAVPVTSYVFHVVLPMTPDGRNLRLKYKMIEVDEGMTFGIRTADIPLPLLTSLRPILMGVTELRVTIQPHVLDFNLTVEAIRPYASTLRSFELYGPAEYWPSTVKPMFPLLPITQDSSVSFPELKCLKFRRISERNCRDMISIFQCPVLEEISIASSDASEAKFEAIYDSSQYVSIEFLHEMLPTIKCLHIHTIEKQLGMLLLNDLAKPDAGGYWLLPDLEVIILDNVRNSILTTLTEIVVNRLAESNRISISPIRSVTLPGFYEDYKGTFQEAYLSTLNLLVAEVKITDPNSRRKYYFTGYGPSFDD
ncbi:hypothetical protein SCHPADRAFT_900363 [Schizopora paradoxa]|uniref:Uncharacterized protein n=1 Tax=Schizopora paradoxa TaxID=27342 RepID=A0A0H2S7I8_9AGAM|nr:hypothetical protein SCHPADRAFT_900363 [Schizopora paradoxa]